MTMTEEEWLNCTDSRLMATFLQGSVSARKDRLFNVACCRRVWRFFRRESVRAAILVGERYADGLADRDELRAALRVVHAGRAAQPSFSPLGEAHHAAGFVCAEAALGGQFAAASNIIHAQALEVSGAHTDEVYAREWRELCSLVREFFANPFRPVKLDPWWLTDNVDALATAIYDDHAFDDLPILADALEDAGCANTDLLGHCRAGGPHYRGCWALDLLLGKS
jgi:hypothetical protein